MREFASDVSIPSLNVIHEDKTNKQSESSCSLKSSRTLFRYFMSTLPVNPSHRTFFVLMDKSSIMTSKSVLYFSMVLTGIREPAFDSSTPLWKHMILLFPVSKKLRTIYSKYCNTISFSDFSLYFIIS